MTYEQLLELEENNGKVSKGLTKEQFARIRERTWMKGSEEASCSICFDDFEKYQKYKQLKGCEHQFHS